MPTMLRPKATVLPASSIVPAENQQLPPKHFTHEVVAAQPYYYTRDGAGGPPDGQFAAGTKVFLQARGRGPLARVVEGRGLRVFTPFAGLREVED